jgi:uncharacterized membrane protein YbhN (UPF0104 family)
VQAWAALAREISRRRVLVGAAVGLPAGAVFIVLAARGVDADRVRATIAAADPLPLAAAAAAIAALYAVQAARWRFVARRAGDLPWSAFLRMIVTSVALNNVVPGRPGDVLRGFWVARALRVPAGRGVATVVVDRSADVLVLLAVLAAGYPLIGHPDWLDRLLAAAVALGVVLVAAAAAARWYARRRAHAGASIRAGARRSWPARQWGQLVRGAAASLVPADLAVIGALSAVVWTLWAVAAFLVAHSLGVSLSLWEAAYVTALINLGAAMPSSPGFIGTFQWLAVAGLGLVAVGRTDAFAFAVVMHAIWYVPTTLAGAALVLRSGAEWIGRTPVADGPPA